MIIKFLKPSRITKGKLVRCADECCSWWEYGDYDTKIGEEFDLNDNWTEIEYRHLTENVDFALIK